MATCLTTPKARRIYLCVTITLLLLSYGCCLDSIALDVLYGCIPDATYYIQKYSKNIEKAKRSAAQQKEAQDDRDEALQHPNNAACQCCVYLGAQGNIEQVKVECLDFMKTKHRPLPKHSFCQTRRAVRWASELLTISNRLHLCVEAMHK